MTTSQASLTTTQAVEFCALYGFYYSRRYIQAAITRGRLPAAKFGRDYVIAVPDLLIWLKTKPRPGRPRAV